MLEVVGNGSRRWMVANRVAERRYGEQNPAYEPAHPHHLSADVSRIRFRQLTRRQRVAPYAAMLEMAPNAFVKDLGVTPVRTRKTVLVTGTSS